MAKEYRPEFFDQDYTLREAYGRFFRYLKPYWARILLGIVCGIIVAGVLVPFYQVMQPATAVAGGEVTQVAAADAAPAPTHKNKLDKQMAKAAKLPSWYNQAEAAAAKVGIKFTDEEGHMQGAMLFLVLVVVPLLMLVRLLMGYLNQYCLIWATTKAAADVRVDLLKHIEKQSMQFFGKVDLGQIMARINNDPSQVQSLMTRALYELAVAPLEITISLAYVIYFAIANEMLTTILFLGIGIPLFIGPIVFLGKKLRKWSKRMLREGSVITSKLHETLTCIKQVKAYDNEAFESGQFRAVNNRVIKMMLRALRIGLTVGPTVEAVGLLMIGILVIIAFMFSIPLSKVIPMLAPLMIIYKPIKEISKLQTQLLEMAAALSRIFSTLDVHMELPEGKNLPLKEFKDEIRFEHVSFRYEGQEVDAVHDATFTIKKGEFVAVVGTTGSGKSTLSALMARFYDPREGRITIDGVDIKDYNEHDLRRVMGAVLQESLIFNDTVTANIAYGAFSPSTPLHGQQIENAAKLANAHDFIIKHPDGYNRVCGEKGANLSGGERQRIAIARAILKNPPILILDEATSALDTVTERLVQDAINNLMAHRTTLAIAHRLSTIRDANQILVMQHGEIVEHGTHDELYAANGVYRQLCDMQKTT